MIYVAGDTHGVIDMRKINKWYGKNQNQIKEEDKFIQLGDWGAIWYHRYDNRKYKKDVELQIKWAKKKFELLVVPGNHENYELIKKLPIEEKYGGKVRVLEPINIYTQKKYKKIYLLERGEIYTIDGKTFLAMGGAKSQDKSTRIIGQDWWEDELWNKEEENNCLSNLDKYNWKVDYVISHTCPEEVGIILNRIKKGNDYGKTIDQTAKFFSFLLKEGLNFKEWHFGHWHMDEKIENFKDENNNKIFYAHYNNIPKQIIV